MLCRAQALMMGSMLLHQDMGASEGAGHTCPPRGSGACSGDPPARPAFCTARTGLAHTPAATCRSPTCTPHCSPAHFVISLSVGALR